MGSCAPQSPPSSTDSSSRPTRLPVSCGARAPRPMRRLILWDFDGTLASRRGETGWSLLPAELLDEHQPGSGITADHVRPFLRDGFPWHRPDLAHPELSEPEAWWRHVEELLVAAYEGVGIGGGRSELASLVRPRYVDTSLGWRLYDDTLPALERLQADGWRHAILSNHVPELPSMVAALGLSSLIDVVFTSVVTGYEKPNRNAFELALRPAAGRLRPGWLVITQSPMWQGLRPREFPRCWCEARSATRPGTRVTSTMLSRSSHRTLRQVRRSSPGVHRGGTPRANQADTTHLTRITMRFLPTRAVSNGPCWTRTSDLGIKSPAGTAAADCCQLKVPATRPT
jgi:putative hydrolase of the HAD superfamily